ncbi:MAG: STAS domain-containing protein [Gammaproteobacteria bacterium]|nr:STAS domain-containing protein [Gammaproteobacteria bacterium]
MGNGQFAVSGNLEIETATDALADSMIKFNPYSEIEVDLSGVTRADSAGLALLLEWVHWAKNTAREIRFKNVPEQIRSIARISEVDSILSAGERWMFPAKLDSNEL